MTSDKATRYVLLVMAVAISSCFGNSQPVETTLQDSTTLPRVETTPEDGTTGPVSTTLETTTTLPWVEGLIDAMNAPTGTQARVTSIIMFDGTDVIMCTLREDVLPPVCVEGLRIVGIGVDSFGETISIGNNPRIWSVDPVTVVGEIRDGVLYVTPSE